MSDRLKKNRFDKRGILTTAVDGHAHLIQTTADPRNTGRSESVREGFTSEAEGHSHPWVLTDGTIVIGEADGHTHSVATVGASARELEERERERVARETQGDGEQRDIDKPLPRVEQEETSKMERTSWKQDLATIQRLDHRMEKMASAAAADGETMVDAYDRLTREASPAGVEFRRLLKVRESASRATIEKRDGGYRASRSVASGHIDKRGQFQKVADVDRELDEFAKAHQHHGESFLDAYCRLALEAGPEGNEFRGLIEKRDATYRRQVA